MSGTWRNAHSRRVRRGAALTLVFASALATGAATNSWGGGSAIPAPRQELSGPADRAPAAEGSADKAATEAAKAAEAKIDAETLVSRSGDRWSAAYTAREYEDFARRLGGSYVGVGLSVEHTAGPRGPETVRVSEVLDGSPAARAGLRKGDRLHAVDGVAVQSEPVTEVVARLRGAPAGTAAEAGEPGSTVTLAVSRDGRQWTTTLRRARLASPAVRVEQPTPGLTRIEITGFTRGVGDRVREAVDQAPAGSRFLLDLRGNSGGLVTEATATASAFLDGGLVATYDHRGEERALRADRGGNTASPLVVLVDGGTMSAAELLTGALQDHGRAVVMGSRTFGKGSVQIPHRMSDGSVAELTVGHYVTPAGREVHGTGLSPDLKVGPGDRALDRAEKVLSGLAAGS